MSGRPPLLIAPDAFKGTFSAFEVAAALGRGFEACGEPPPDLCPIADGGEGTLGVLLLALGGETAGARVTGPLGAPVDAGFALIEDGGTAIVEVASACGLPLLGGPPSVETAWEASSRGVGELVLAAVGAGAEVVLVCAGGSATTDGGAGALAAIEEGGGLRGASVVVLCDVRTAFLDAPRVFGPQKGADEATVARLRERLEALAASWPVDVRGVAGAGAAGGLAGGLMAGCGAQLVAGAPFVLDALDYDTRMRAAHAVIVGEGRLDETTLDGKAACEAATRARQAGVPCFAVCGEDRMDRLGHRILDLQTVTEAPTLEAIEAAAAGILPYL